MGHQRPNDHHHGSSAKRFSSKLDLTTKHADDMACITHPSGNTVSRRNIKARPCSQIRPPEDQRAPRAWAFDVWEVCCGRGAMPRVTGLQPLPGQRPMLQVMCQAGVKGGGTGDGAWPERQCGGGRGRPHCSTTAVRVWRTYRT